MNTESMYYFVELAKDFHITNTANRLFISQQTLSNHITRLEKELGAQLLYRSPNQGLTLAGEKFLDFCQTTLLEHRNMIDQMVDIQKETCGVIRFGASHFRMSNSIHHILNLFYSIYPHVSFDLIENTSAKLEEMVTMDTLDFCIVLATDPHPNMTAHTLLMDQTYVCVSDLLLQQYYNPEERITLKKKMQNGVEIRDIARLPFCMFRNRMGMQINMCFQEAKLKPRVFITSTHIDIAMRVCKNNLAACFSTQMALADDFTNIARINTFPLLHQNRPISQKLVILHKKNRYLPSYSTYFLKMLLQYFEKIEHRDFIHIVKEA